MGFCRTVKNIASDIIVILASTIAVVTSVTFIKGAYNQYWQSSMSSKSELKKFEDTSACQKFNEIKEKVENAGGTFGKSLHKHIKPFANDIYQRTKAFLQGIQTTDELPPS